MRVMITAICVSIKCNVVNSTKRGDQQGGGRYQAADEDHQTGTRPPHRDLQRVIPYAANVPSSKLGMAVPMAMIVLFIAYRTKSVPPAATARHTEDLPVVARVTDGTLQVGGILKTSTFGFTDDTKTQYKGNNAPTTNTANTR